MKYLSVLLTLMLVVCRANAFEIELDGGLTRASTQSDGIWWQAENAHHLTVNAPTASIGVYTDPMTVLGLKNTQVGIGAAWIGRFTSDAMIYDQDNCTNPNKCGPLSHMQGQGIVKGAFIAVRHNFDDTLFHGALKDWFVELSVYATRPSWETTNFDWYGGPNCTGPTTANCVGPIVSHLNHDEKTLYGLSGAVGKHITDKLSVELKIVPTHASNLQADGTYIPGIYKGYSPSVVLKYSFKGL